MPHAFSYDQKLIINIMMILIKKIPHFRKYLISLSENRIKNILYIKKNHCIKSIQNYQLNTENQYFVCHSIFSQKLYRGSLR